MAHPLASESYVSLTTYRRTGVPVSTPVWIAALGDSEELVVITMDEVGKVKRLRNNSQVRLTPCDVRGRIRPGAPSYDGTGRVSAAPQDVAVVKRAMGRKHLLARIGNLAQGVLGRFGTPKPRAAIFLEVQPQPTT